MGDRRFGVTIFRVVVMTMNDYEIDEIRCIRHQISQDHGHDLQRIAEYYRNIEKELRQSDRYQFANEHPHEVEPASTKDPV